MTEIRRLNPEDLPQLYRMETLVFNQQRDFSKEEKEDEEEDDGEDDSLAQEQEAHGTWGAFENGKLLSGMHDTDYLMRFDGHSVKMSGVGGVGTLPEARNGGYVRRIFEKLLPEAYENGVVFSSLTPFSHEFYRKFGYEIACSRNNINIPTKDFFKIKPYGEFVPIFPGDDTSLLAEVHSAYIADINHAIHRDYWPNNRAWKYFAGSDPYATGTFLYLWKDETGKARSYIKYKYLPDDEESGMSVKELAFIDKKGLYGALGIVSGLSAQYKSFQWAMPTFIDPCDFISGSWGIDQHINPRDMTRVVNVKTALELMRLPYGEGEYVIEVEDANLAANSGKYLVEFGPEGSRVSPASRDADLHCNILVLSQLVVGYRTIKNALYSRQTGLEVYGNMETLNRVFTLRPQHVTEYF